jgi:2-polyprenyl-6-methoxyphenol hydroxylase-like FAD-dependent oxidoreductase
MATHKARRTQVLIVGAGPVGLTAALGLTGEGFDVRIVDRDSGPPSTVLPVILHAQTLRILHALGAGAVLTWRGHGVDELALRGDSEVELSLGLRTHDSRRSVLTVGHNVLCQTLTHLLENRGVTVEWNTELLALDQGGLGVSARLARRSHSQPALLPGEQAAEGLSTVADYVIGADGYHSTVRALLEAPLEHHGPLKAYAFFEGQLASTHRAKVVLAKDTISSVYPLGSGRARFCVQLTALLHRTPDAEQLQRLAAWRLPECDTVHSCEFRGVAEFRDALTTRFGQGRVWLAGDAAHTTAPFGGQSLNAGMDEASQLALAIGEALRGCATRFAFGETYQSRRTREWRRLLGLEELPTGLHDWSEADLRRVMPCLPASAKDSSQLLGQLMAQSSSARRASTR